MTGSAAVLYPGDLNTDEAVNILDGVMLARTVGEDDTLELTAQGKRNADVDLSGFVGVDDLYLLINQLAGYVPKAQPVMIPDTTTSTTTTTTTTTSTTTTATTTTTTTTTTFTTTSSAATTTTTTAPLPSAPELTVDNRKLPLEVPLSALSVFGTPNETLTVPFQSCNMTFAIYADQPEQTMIGIAADGIIVGYYIFGGSFTAPDGYSTVEYIDTNSKGTGKLYALLTVKDGYSIRFGYMKDRSDFSVMSKLNYYGVNGIRAANGLSPLIWDENMAKVALAHSKDMADYNYFEHNSRDGSKFSARFTAAGIDWQRCAENIDCGYTDPFGSLNGWFTSESGHRKNILSAEYTHIGIGFAYNADSRYGYYGTQDFYKGWD